jgi:hypothetical protein
MIPASTGVALLITHDDQEVEALFLSSFHKGCIQSATGTWSTKQRIYGVDCTVGHGDRPI